MSSVRFAHIPLRLVNDNGIDFLVVSAWSNIFFSVFCMNVEKKSNVKIGSRKRKEQTYCCPWAHNTLNIRRNFRILHLLFFLIYLNCIITFQTEKLEKR